MARKKKHKKTHRRRRVGALPTGGIMGGVVTVGAGLAGVVIGKVVANMLTSMSGTIVGAVQTGVGVFGVAKLKSPLTRAFAAGVGINGAMTLVGSKGLAILPASIGYGPNPMHAVSRMAGYREVPKIGFPKPGVIGADRDRRRMARMYAGVYG